jgi:hypothetical protein
VTELGNILWTCLEIELGEAFEDVSLGLGGECLLSLVCGQPPPEIIP